MIAASVKHRMAAAVS